MVFACVVCCSVIFERCWERLCCCGTARRGVTRLPYEVVLFAVSTGSNRMLVVGLGLLDAGEKTFGSFGFQNSMNQMSAEVRIPPEFKHIIKGRKRN